MKDPRPSCKHRWVEAYDPDAPWDWARCTKCGDEYTWIGLFTEYEEQMDDTVDTKATSAEAEEQVLDTREVKTILARARGEEHYDLFRAFIGTRLNETVVPEGIVMCVTLACAVEKLSELVGAELHRRIR